MIRLTKLPFLSSLSKRAQLIVLGVGGLFVVGAGGSSYALFDYTQNDPRFCLSCHIMDDAYERWSKSEHSKVSCHECHAPDVEANLRQLYIYTTNPPAKPSHAPELANTVCYECHRVDGEHDGAAVAASEQWKDVLAEAGHAEHVSEQKIQCIRCHSTSLHSFAAPKDLCSSCHKHTRMVGSDMDAHCTSCHTFTATARPSLAPTRGECLGCHSEMQVKAEVFPEKNGQSAPMQWACGKCHKPHSQSVPMVADCKSCHAEKLGSDVHAVAAHGDCMSCHKPHLWKVTTSAPCLACHADREKHAEGEVCASCHE